MINSITKCLIWLSVKTDFEPIIAITVIWIAAFYDLPAKDTLEIMGFNFPSVG